MVAGLMACSTMSRTPVADTKQKRRYLLSWTRLLRSATRARSSRNASRKSSTVAIRFPSRPQRSPIWATSQPSRKPPWPPPTPVPRIGSSWTAQAPLRVPHDFRDGAARPRPVQGRPRGALSGNWITTASKGSGDDLRRVAASGRVLHEPSVPRADSYGIAYTRSNTNASGQTEEDLAGWRPVTLAAPTGWQLEQNEPQRGCRSRHGKWLRGRGKLGHLAFDLKRVEAAQPGLVRMKPLYFDRSDHNLVPLYGLAA